MVYGSKNIKKRASVNMKKKLIFLSLTLLWMIFIFCMSAQVASDSSEQSMFITERIIRFFISEPSPELLIFAEVIVRKAAHFTEYFILAGLVFATLKEFKKTEKKHI